MNGNEKLPRRAAKITTARPLAAGATIADGVQTRGNTCCGARPQGAGATRSEPRQEPLAAAREVDGDVRTPIRIMQMDCPTEEGMIRKKLASLPAVTAMEFNLMQRVLMVVHRPDSLDSILAAIRSLGFTPQIAAADAPLADDDLPRQRRWPLVLAAIAAFASEISHWLSWPDGISAVLALLAVVACGLTTYKKGWLALRQGTMNINALMSITVTGALLIGQWPEAAMVMVLFTLAELIEARSLDRARNAISGLLQSVPATASQQQADGSWQEVEVDTVPVGSLLRVKPGERVALDGTVEQGNSTVDQASITGESLPVEKRPGDTVFAGTLNQAGSFSYRVTATIGDTTLARIIHAVSEAQGNRAPTQRFVDRFARIYTPLILVLEVLVALLPPLLLGGGWYEWIYKALVMLVIACPCALVISTPVTIVSGLAAAARQGILIKGGVYLEKGRSLRWLALDKTGTLTHGKPILTDRHTFGVRDAEALYQLAAGLASRSDHPVSQAIIQAAEREGNAPVRVTDFTALPGRGITGVTADSQWYLGNRRLADELGLSTDVLDPRAAALEQQGKTLVMLMGEGKVQALFAVADTLKSHSRAAIAQLHQAGVKILMLSGDNTHTARAIAAQAGIDEAYGDQLPEDKLQKINQLADRGTVGMVGDGINDAPALARADIGFAMGALGSDTAIETADVALMDDDLRKAAQFIRLSRATHRILIQNIALALGIKAVFLLLTLAGAGTMWMAVFADVGTSLLVVANGLRLLRQAPRSRPTPAHGNAAEQPLL
ncbi:putative cadmium-transporting ATPase [Sodalis glossinidius str. 'morsitans']|uniref:P-type Zn(2+) transporter n=1 Tax=Sodalis glossinidius (strain morsitans) TaxID=343509 RepID=Q2NRU7_SODGM|nr:heavy metal translocating P-type ATPase [Sodalis glossinidius]BAE75128.1 putative cation transport ATPase [Sodalis glossinidius str. 'morsitans']CRL46062.1 putative cadmium-transporting ATPase [Sodalis glossinidius str. 'morsitans']